MFRKGTQQLQTFLMDIASFTFLQHALAAGILASVSCGIVGSYVVTRRISYIAGAIAHCTLGGMGAAIYFNREMGWSHATPLAGAVAAALSAAVIIGLARQYGQQREDSVLGAIWSTGMAVGILFISRTGGYNEDLMGYLFGNILMVSTRDLWLIAALDVVVIIFTTLFYNRIVASCFDEEFAQLAGINVNFFHMMLLLMTALTVVTLVQVVGLVMVIALLTLPASAASVWATRLSGMMFLSVILSMLAVTGGLAASYGPDLPSGAVIIMLSAGIYLLSIVMARFRGGRR
jgi:zinc transport system permease protein